MCRSHLLNSLIVTLPPIAVHFSSLHLPLLPHSPLIIQHSLIVQSQIQRLHQKEWLYPSYAQMHLHSSHHTGMTPSLHSLIALQIITMLPSSNHPLLDPPSLDRYSNSYSLHHTLLTHKSTLHRQRLPSRVCQVVDGLKFRVRRSILCYHTVGLFAPFIS